MSIDCHGTTALQLQMTSGRIVLCLGHAVGALADIARTRFDGRRPGSLHSSDEEMIETRSTRPPTGPVPRFSTSASSMPSPAMLLQEIVRNGARLDLHRLSWAPHRRNGGFATGFGSRASRQLYRSSRPRTGPRHPADDQRDRTREVLADSGTRVPPRAAPGHEMHHKAKRAKSGRSLRFDGSGTHYFDWKRTGSGSGCGSAATLADPYPTTETIAANHCRPRTVLPGSPGEPAAVPAGLHDGNRRARKADSPLPGH